MFRLMLLFASSGVLLMLVSLPAALCLLRPNSAFGICVGAALKSTGNWYEINMCAGWRMFQAGIGTVLAALTFYFLPNLSVGAYYCSCVTVMVGLFGIGLYRTARHLQYYNEK